MGADASTVRPDGFEGNRPWNRVERPLDDRVDRLRRLESIHASTARISRAVAIRSQVTVHGIPPERADAFRQWRTGR